MLEVWWYLGIQHSASWWASIVRCQGIDRVSDVQVSIPYIYHLQHKKTLLWRRNGHDGVPNHQPHHCLLNHLFRSKKKSKLRVTGLCAGNSPGNGEFPAKMASNAENASIWWHHHKRLPLSRWQFLIQYLDRNVMFYSNFIEHCYSKSATPKGVTTSQWLNNDIGQLQT